MTAQRVLLKLSGEVLAGGTGHGIHADTLGSLAGALIDLTAEGCRVGVVVGGGNFVRGRELRTTDRNTADQMGMLSTLINGLALRDALKQRGASSVVLSAIAVEGFLETYSPAAAVEYLENGFVVIYVGGTGNTFLTTDTAAALRAVQTGCCRMLKGTKVDGIYDADPMMYPEAKRFREISYREALELNLKVMDAAALAVCRDSRLPVSVFDIREASNIVRVYRDPSFGSTIRGGENDRSSSE